MNITIDQELQQTLTDLAETAGKSETDYVQYIINNHLQDKRPEVLAKKIEFVGTAEVEAQIEVLEEAKKAELEAERVQNVEPETPVDPEVTP